MPSASFPEAALEQGQIEERADGVLCSGLAGYPVTVDNGQATLRPARESRIESKREEGHPVHFSTSCRSNAARESRSAPKPSAYSFTNPFSHGRGVEKGLEQSVEQDRVHSDPDGKPCGRKRY